MKKIALLSAFALCVFAAGCGNNNPEVENECLDGEECVVVFICFYQTLVSVFII